jgi:Protein of unknown function (DUF2846)
LQEKHGAIDATKRRRLTFQNSVGLEKIMKMGNVMEALLAVVLCTSPVFAQDQAEAARSAAGCGAGGVAFTVKTDKKQHPVAPSQPGKALVYVFGDEEMDNIPLHIGGITTRWGLDGAWVGANYRKSYFFFYVDPGDHRLCTSRQTKFKSQTKSAAISFTSEAGKIYYFHTKTPHHEPPETVILVAADTAAAQLLIADSAFSVSHPKPAADSPE